MTSVFGTTPWSLRNIGNWPFHQEKYFKLWNGSHDTQSTKGLFWRFFSR